MPMPLLTFIAALAHMDMIGRFLALKLLVVLLQLLNVGIRPRTGLFEQDVAARLQRRHVRGGLLHFFQS
jgi:hypothetical protein